MSNKDNSRITVVIADDDRSIRETIKKCLENSKYVIKAEASNGMEAITKCKEILPELLLIDIAMPNMDGVAATKIIKHENLAKTVVILTSFSDETNIQKAVQAGAIGYLTKPIVKENVLSTLEICLRRSKEYHLAQKEYKSIEKRLESRKYIDKAKLLIMEQNGISETEAYETIRELSHLKGLSMEEISKYITTEGRS